jgi:UDPglucose 6-dehydrogenase
MLSVSTQLRRDNSTIIVIGAGIVGGSTGKGLIKKGYDVVFVDKNPNVIRSLKDKGYRAYLPMDLTGQEVSACTTMICVDTPLSHRSENNNNQDGVDLGNIAEAILTHSEWLRNNKSLFHSNGDKFYHLIVIRSTVPPGTTRGMLLPLIEKYSGLKVGEDFGLCMQPEFLRTVSAEEDFLHPRATIIGQYDKRSGDSLEEIYSSFEGQKIKVDLEMAEFMKFIHNSFNATKISFSNEMWLLGQTIGLDANIALQLAAKTAEGLWNPNYGLIGGQPYGGHCLPKDTRGFERFAQQNKAHTPVLSATIKVNEQMEEMAKHGKVSNATLGPPDLIVEKQILSEKNT